MYFTSDYSHGTYLFATLDFTLYISYKTTFFQKIIVKSFLNGFDHFCTRRNRHI